MSPNLPGHGLRRSVCQHLRRCKLTRNRFCCHSSSILYYILTLHPHIQDTLTYGCLCDDNKTPNVSQYSLTLPYFTCTQWGIQCVAACGSDNKCASACTQDHPCGALDPTPPNSTNATKTAATTSSSASSTSTGDAIYTSLGGDDKSAASGPPASELARLYSTMGTLGLFCIGFAYLL